MIKANTNGKLKNDKYGDDVIGVQLAEGDQYRTQKIRLRIWYR
jgi:hypothetical protein